MDKDSGRSLPTYPHKQNKLHTGKLIEFITNKISVV